jgi:hypothetical protein
MNISLSGIVLLIGILSSPPLFAINFQTYVKSLRLQNANETSRSTLLGIIGSCGSNTHLDDDCLIEGLERVAVEENNREALAIIKDYEKALAEGNFEKPECQTDSHLQSNRTIGHCVLLLNNYMIENNDKESATAQYELCLQGGMLGLAYAGNISAAFLLSEIFREKNVHDPANHWSNFVRTKRGSDDYEVLMRCYG